MAITRIKKVDGGNPYTGLDLWTPRYLYPAQELGTAMPFERPSNEFMNINTAIDGDSRYSGVYPCLAENGVRYRLRYLNYLDISGCSASDIDAGTYASILDGFEGYDANNVAWVFAAGSDQIPEDDLTVGDYLYLSGQASDYPNRGLKVLGFGIDIGTGDQVIMVDMLYVFAGLSGLTNATYALVRYNVRVPIELWLKDELLAPVTNYEDGAYLYKTIYTYPQFNPTVEVFDAGQDIIAQWLYVDIAEPCRQKLLNTFQSMFQDCSVSQQLTAETYSGSGIFVPYLMVYAALKGFEEQNGAITSEFFMGNAFDQKGWSAVMYAKTFAKRINLTRTLGVGNKTLLNEFPILNSEAKGFIDTTTQSSSDFIDTALSVFPTTPITFERLNGDFMGGSDDYPAVFISTVDVSSSPEFVPTLALADYVNAEEDVYDTILYNDNGIAIVWINKYGVPNFWVFSAEDIISTEFEDGDLFNSYRSINGGYNGSAAINRPETFKIRVHSQPNLDQYYYSVFEDLFQSTHIYARPYALDGSDTGIYNFSTYPFNLCRIANITPVTNQRGRSTFDVQFDLILEVNRAQQLR